MSNANRRQGLTSWAVALASVLVAVASGLILSHVRGLSPAPPLVVSALGLAALLFEWAAVETAYLGFVSFAPLFYLLLALLGSPALALGLAALGILARASLHSRQEGLQRVLDFGSGLLSAAALIAVASLVSRVADAGGHGGSPALATLAAAVAYFLVDLGMAGLGSVYLADRTALQVWRLVRSRTRVAVVASLPLAAFACPAAAAAGSDPLALGVAVVALTIPLVAMRASLVRLVEQGVAKKPERVDRTTSLSPDDAFDYKQQNRALMEDLQKRVDEITILYEMGQQLGASKDLDKTLDIVIKMVRRLLIYQSCVIYLTDEEGGLVPARWVSPYAELIELSPTRQLDDSTVELVLLNKKSVLIHERRGGAVAQIFSDERCQMCVPLIVKDDIIGVIYVGTLRPGSYSEDQVHLLETLANPAAIAIRSAQFHAVQELQLVREQTLRQQSNERNMQLDVLYTLGRDLNRSIKIKEILDIVTVKLALLVPFQSCIFFIMRPNESALVPVNVASPYEDLFRGFTASPDDQETILGWVALNKRPVLLADTRDSGFSSIIANERSLILLPLIADEEVIGEMYLGAAEASAYDNDTLGLVNMVASQAAMAVQKALLFEKTESLAITDGVTGLYTHRYFQERLSEEIRWAEGAGRCVSLVMVDTDHFKKFNDTLGHPEGDRLLREIAALLRSYTRDSDVACRYGGDEFSLILRDTPKESALVTAEQVREAFQLRFGNNLVKVTSSIGVATLPTDARNKAELVAAADAALYRSKQGGRNRVSGATPLESKRA